MFYEHAVTTPANTPKASPLQTEIVLAPGVVRFVELQFPRGCVGLVHARIRDELHQVWPTNPDGDIASDDARIAWSEEWPITNVEGRLILETWNDDDSFPHTVTFRFNVLEEAFWQRQQAAIGALDYLARWFAQAPPA